MQQKIENAKIITDPPHCAVVTGAQGGIGNAIIEKLIIEGIQVVAVDLSEDYSAFKVNPNMIHIQKCDISDEQQVSELWIRLANQNLKIDILVNNAGVYPGVDWKNYDAVLAQKVLNTNVTGAFLMSQKFAKQSTLGAIINISSVSAFTGSSDPIYGASKAALIGLTKSLALAFAPHIRVNAIAPSLVNTPMLANVPQGVLQHFQKHELLPFGIESEAIADAVIFLSSSRAKNMTGSTLDVNNGVYLR